MNDRLRMTFVIALWCTLACFMLIDVCTLDKPIYDYDESGQFFIAKGLNHYSAPLSEVGGLSDVIEQNANYNLDPGGYSVMLHFWTLVSNDIVWVRILSLLFFVTALGFIYKIVLKITGDALWGVLMLNIFFFFNAYFIFSTRIRGYALEMLGAAFVAYVLLNMTKVKPIWALLVGIMFAAFSTSRYAIIPVIGLACFFLIIQWRKKENVLLLFFPLLLVMILVYNLSYRIQSSAGVMNIYNGQYLTSNPKLLIKVWILPYLVSLTLTICDYFKGNRNKTRFKMSLFVFLCNTFFIVTSLIEIHPWGNEKCFALNTLSLLYLVVMGGIWLRNHMLRYAVAGIVFLLAGYRMYNLYQRFFIEEEPYGFVERYGVNPSDYSLVFVDAWEASNIRYNIEYGPNKDEMEKLGYPSHFYFGYGTKHSAKHTDFWLYDENVFMKCNKYLILKEKNPVIKRYHLKQESRYIYSKYSF